MFKCGSGNRPLPLCVFGPGGDFRTAWLPGPMSLTDTGRAGSRPRVTGAASGEQQPPLAHSGSPPALERVCLTGSQAYLGPDRRVASSPEFARRHGDRGRTVLAAARSRPHGEQAHGQTQQGAGK